MLIYLCRVKAAILWLYGIWKNVYDCKRLCFKVLKKKKKMIALLSAFDVRASLRDNRKVLEI